MADTTTANYGWVKPDVGASDDTWGNKLNTNFDGIDSVVEGVSVAAGAAQATATGAATAAAAAQTTASAALPLAGGTLTGPLVLAADPAAALQPSTKQYVDAIGARQNRNRVINGQFRVNQRAYASGTALAANAYAHDRWKAGASGCTYSFTASGAGATPNISLGSLLQIIEDVNIEGGNYTLSWTGTAQGRINASAYSASPLTVTGLPAATAVTVEFQGGTVANVQLELGAQATPFDWRSYGEELALCQRYFYKPTGIIAGSAYGTAASSGVCFVTRIFPVTMRAAPTQSGQTFTGSSNVQPATVASLSTSLATWQALNAAAGSAVLYLQGTDIYNAEL